MQENTDFKTHDGVSAFDEELCLMPPNHHISHNMNENNVLSMQSTRQTNQKMRLDLERSAQKQDQNKP